MVNKFKYMGKGNSYPYANTLHIRIISESYYLHSTHVTPFLSLLSYVIQKFLACTIIDAARIVFETIARELKALQNALEDYVEEANVSRRTNYLP